jgi:hypothetical protein
MTSAQQIENTLREWLLPFVPSHGFLNVYRSDEDVIVRLSFNTQTSKYILVARSRPDGSPYLAGYAGDLSGSSYQDFPDGDFSKDTFDRIISAVVRNELRPIAEDTRVELLQ